MYAQLQSCRNSHISIPQQRIMEDEEGFFVDPELKKSIQSTFSPVKLPLKRDPMF